MLQRIHIQANLITATWLVIFGLLVLPQAISQPVVSISNHAGCANSEILVPVEVNNFADVAAFTFYIQADTSAIALISVENIHPALLEGNVVSNFNINGIPSININWYGMSSVTISSGKLFDLRLLLKGGTTAFSFTENCEIALSDLSVVQNVVYNDGSLTAFSALSPVPLTSTVIKDSTANFVLPLFSGITYQWQENSGNIWTNLAENLTYKGVLTNELSLISVPMSFNNRSYRSLLTKQLRSENTLAATLMVNAVGIDEHGLEKKSLISVFPNPVGDRITYLLGVSISQATLRLIDTKGNIVLQSKITNIKSGTSQSLNLDKLAAGTYILQLIDDNKIIDSVKILRQL